MQIDEHKILKPFTSYNVGGEADYYAEPTSIAEIIEVVKLFQAEGIPIFFLGHGSNLLISDKGYRGAVINLMSFDNISIDGEWVTADAGARLTKMIMQAVSEGLGGLEQLAGIPGSVGGGVLMNAGAYSQNISDKIKSVIWLDLTTGEILETPIEELIFGYRTSIFRNLMCVVLQVTFALETGDKVALREKVLEIQERRRNSQPLNFPSCGSVFKRPEGNYAGALIEAAGLKGFSVGGATVSEKHANFIINSGNATAENIRQCISKVRKAVCNQSGILLEPEVIFVGEFDSEIYTIEETE